MQSIGENDLGYILQFSSYMKLQWKLNSALVTRRLVTWWFQKFVNVQYNTLGRLDNGTNESSTKRLMLQVQYTLDLRKPDLRKNLDLRKIVATTDFLVHKLFDLRKIF